MNFGAENDVKQYFINALKNLGWGYLSEKECNELRDNDFNEPFLLAHLKGFLKAKQGLDDEQCQIAIKELKSKGLNGGLLAANEQTTQMLLHGISIKKDLKYEQVYFIDFNNLANNSFIFTDEFKLNNNDTSEKESTRIDLVMLVNGIPLVSIELKQPSVDVSEAINQLQNHQKPGRIDSFYRFIQLCIASNGISSKYATVKSSPEFYCVFKDGTKDLSVDIITRNILTPSNLLEFIKDFVFFSGGKKIASRYQQYFGIKNTIKALEQGHGGLIWHTQGSGKSYTMLLLINKLRHLYPQAQKIIITDRIELDEQINKTLSKTKDTEKLYHATSANHLNKLLNNHSVGLITSTIFKFDELSVDKNRLRFVLIDEAHRSQSGEMHMLMKDILGDNAYYVGLTGTPLLSKDKHSIKKFGGLLHTYSIRDGVEDGAILPLLYENKMLTQEILMADELERKFEDITKDCNSEQKELLKQKWAKIKKLNNSLSRLEYIALDVNEDYKNTLKHTKFNAMLACESKFAAMKYYEIFKELGDLKVAVIMSSDMGDENRGKEAQWVSNEYAKLNVGDYEQRIKREFIAGELDLLIVVDKLLTGFDAPLAKKLYVDKSLKEHNLLQAIARVNRVCASKDVGIVVDYRGLLGELDRAFSEYDALSGYDESDLGDLIDNICGQKDEAFAVLAKLDEMFQGAISLKECLEVLSNKSVFDEFKALVASLGKLSCVVLNSQRIRNSLSSDEKTELKQGLVKYTKLKSAAILAFAGEDFRAKDYEGALKQLFDEHIRVGEMVVLNEQVDILSPEFKRIVSLLDGADLMAKAVLNNLKIPLSKYEIKNPMIFEKFSLLIQDALKDYELKRLSDSEFYKKSCEILEEFKSEISSKNEALLQNLAAKFDEAAAVDLAQKIKKIFAKPEYFHKDESTCRLITYEIAQLLCEPLRAKNELNLLETYSQTLLNIYLENAKS